ncbi:MAG: nuclear transport factor 2 family protein [Bacteroidetes bacterium]|nr:nuclear transport factor 2 family protein [Bacteroidota bacterium]
MKYILCLAVALVATVGYSSLSAQPLAPAQPQAVAQPGHAPSTEDSVKAAVNLLFTGMLQSSAATIRSSFADSAILQTIVEKDGKTTIRNEQVEDFAQAISKLEKGVADERIRFDVVRIDDNLAIVWAPYSFYYKGQLNHCGVDSFQLLRTSGGWKIIYLIDTRRKQPCQ